MSKYLGEAYYKTHSVLSSLFDKSILLSSPKDLNPQTIGLLVVWGGTDISTDFYGEKANRYCQSPNLGRDHVERTLITSAWEQNIPVVGVCRGAQMLCCMNGGKLIQHTNGHHGGHPIETKDGKQMHVSSEHHQMMLPSGDYELLAWSKNNLSTLYLGENEKELDLPLDWKEPEVIYYPQTNSLAVQGHPEWMSNTCQFNEWMMQFIRERMLNKQTCEC